MPAAIWSGAISFGLVTIPIKVVTATQSHAVSFHQYHLADQGRVRYRKTCELDGQELPDDQIGKAYELSKDQLIPVTDQELADLPLPTAKAIEIVAFVPADSIDPIRLSDSYYLEASGPVAAKPYILLREALKRSERVAVAKFALRGRERLGLLSIKEDALVLHNMKWDDEIRDSAELAPRETAVDEDEIAQAMQLMDTMAAEDLTGFRDEYRDALEEVIAAKQEGHEPPAPAPSAPAAGRVVDLMAALEESVRTARESRGEDATVHEMPAKKITAKKTGRRKRA
ncbi:non-homologous end joining protein Ku [Streptomyces odonnellii]|uniref:non-homologous end joining protein Ku n=1 Tax=Streptomyces odonnellii TaxID=1417980 RepID=UPI0006257D61|nr:Ku protein [Streptomyces odonnellii]